MDMHRLLLHQLAQQNLDLTARMSGEHLPKLLHFRSRGLVILDMPDQQGFGCLSIEPLLTGTHPLGTQCI